MDLLVDTVTSADCQVSVRGRVRQNSIQYLLLQVLCALRNDSVARVLGGYKATPVTVIYLQPLHELLVGRLENKLRAMRPLETNATATCDMQGNKQGNFDEERSIEWGKSYTVEKIDAIEVSRFVEMLSKGNARMEHLLSQEDGFVSAATPEAIDETSSLCLLVR